MIGQRGHWTTECPKIPDKIVTKESVKSHCQNAPIESRRAWTFTQFAPILFRKEYFCFVPPGICYVIPMYIIVCSWLQMTKLNLMRIVYGYFDGRRVKRFQSFVRSVGWASVHDWHFVSSLFVCRHPHHGISWEWGGLWTNIANVPFNVILGCRLNMPAKLMEKLTLAMTFNLIDENRNFSIPIKIHDEYLRIAWWTKPLELYRVNYSVLSKNGRKSIVFLMHFWVLWMLHLLISSFYYEYNLKRKKNIVETSGRRANLALMQMQMRHQRNIVHNVQMNHKKDHSFSHEREWTPRKRARWYEHTKARSENVIGDQNSAELFVSWFSMWFHTSLS